MSKATIPILEERLNHEFNPGQFDFPHGSVYAAGKLWLSAQMLPGRVARIDPGNLSSFDIVTLPNDGSHIRGLDLAYSSVTDRIYVLHYSTLFTNVTAIDPDTLAVTDVVADSDVSNINGSLALTPTHLFAGSAVGSAGDPAADDAFILKYSLIDYSKSASVELAGLKQCHALDYDGTNLYATGLTSTGDIPWVAKINPTTLAYTSALLPAGIGLPTDDLAIYGDYLYVGLENAGAGRILKIAKADLAITQIPTRPSNANFYGLFADNTHIWAVTSLVPAGTGIGKMIRLDPTTLEQRLYSFNDGESADGPNEIMFIPPYMFVTFYQSGAKISRLRIPTA